MKKRLIYPTLIIFALVLIQGCATSGDLQRVEQKIVALRTDLESTQNKQKRLLRKIQELEHNLAKMDKALTSFRKASRYKFANIGVEISELRSKHQQLLGLLQDLKREFDNEAKRNRKLFKDYATRFGDPTAGDASTPQVKVIVVSPEAAFDAAKKLFEAGKYKESQQQLTDFVTKYPSHKLTPDAYLLLGDIYLKFKKFFEAITIYNKIRKKFPSSSLVPQSLFKVGVAHYKMGACFEGTAFFKAVERQFKSSEFAQKSRYYRRHSRTLCKKR